MTRSLRPARFLLFLALLVPACASAQNFQWYNTTTTRVRNTDGIALPASTSHLEGCFVQLIYAGPNGTNDLAKCGINTTGATADDLVVDRAWFGYGTGFIYPLEDGCMNAPRNFNAGGYGSGAKFFVRAWTAPASAYNPTNVLLSYVPVSETNRYGDSGIFTYSGGFGEIFYFGSPTGYVAALVPNLDSNGDGIPDWWEKQYFTNVPPPAATNDTDSDGFTNIEEYWANTNPTNAQSFFAGIAAFAGGHVAHATLPETSIERYYDIAASTQLTGAVTWTPMNLLLTGTGSNLLVALTNTPPTQFYRGIVHTP